MSMVSVNIPAMARLVKTMDSAAAAIPGDYTRVRRLSSSPVDLAPLATAPQIASWLHDEVGPMRTKLAYARWLDASTPGVQNTVRFDEKAIPDITPEQAKALAARARALMVKGRPPSKELLDLLKKYGGNPQFAAYLMNGFKPSGKGHEAELEASGPDLDYVAHLPPGAASEKFLKLYSQILGGQSGDQPHPNFRGRPGPGQSDPQRLRAWALLASRGNWSKEWLVGLGEDLIAAERDDPKMWSKKDWNSGDNVNPRMHEVFVPKDPHGVPVQDPMVWFLNGLSRNPEAADAFLNGGGPAAVKSDGKRTTIPANLRFLTLERGWPQDGGISLAMALGAAKSLPDTATDHNLEVLKHLDEVDGSWGELAGHTVLDLWSMLPFMGSIAGAINLVWNLADGNNLDALFDALSIIPGGGVSKIGKFIKLLNAAGEAGNKVLTLVEVKKLLEQSGMTPQAAGQATVQPVPEDATYLGPVDGREWYDGLHLEPGRTYVLDSGVVLRTGPDGRIAEVGGDVEELDPASRKWINEHRQPGHQIAPEER